MSFVDCHCKCRPARELAPVPFNILLILTFYFHHGGEYILSSIVSWGYHAVEKDDGGFTKDDSCTIAKSSLGCDASQKHEDHAFHYVKVMWREICLWFHGTSGGISGIYMREKLLTFLIHIRKLIKQIVCSHSFATGRFIIILFHKTFFNFINNQGKQHKMLKKRPVATGWLQTICAIRSVRLLFWRLGNNLFIIRP